MADKVNITSLTNLISAFRQITAKDSITPESLGYILQRIADLLGTVNTSEVASEFSKLLGILKLNGNILTNIVQGQADRNHIYADISHVNLSNGETGKSSGIFIQQATTERAGAMRAQQVTDLNTARDNINNKIIPQLKSIEERIGELQSPSISQINAQIVRHEVHIRGAQAFIKAGYVPYLFRITKKRNRFRDKEYSKKYPDKKFSDPTKGWHLFGSCHSIKIEGDRLLFSTNPPKRIHTIPSDYTPYASDLIHEYKNKKGFKCITWGRSRIILNDVKREKAGFPPRMIKLRLAIGFGKKQTPCKVKITPSFLKSGLAEFSLIFDPKSKTWDVGK